MNLPRRLLRSNHAAAAVELALVTPLLLIIMFGSFELGNYFLDEHRLVKAVREGARFAGRQNFSNFNCPSGTIPGGSVVTDTQNVVRTGLLSGNSQLPSWLLANVEAACPPSAATKSCISVTFVCKADLNGGTLNPPSGIYNGSSGTAYAPVVSVSATVPYLPLLSSFGFRGTILNLNASQQAAVTGI
jgi:hypothetical protein